MRETPVFLGLTRPPKFFGLPIGYFIGLMMTAVIPFVGLDEWKFLLLIPAAYPVLWVVADRNPALFEILATVYTATPPTTNRAIRGGGQLWPHAVDGGIKYRSVDWKSGQQGRAGGAASAIYVSTYR